MKQKVYLIANIEEYGKLISYCINNDISVWRTYWDEREKNKRCYHIDYKEKRCYYAKKEFYEEKHYEIVKPIFYLDIYGNYHISQIISKI